MTDERIGHPLKVFPGETQSALNTLQRRLDIDKGMPHVLHQFGPVAIGTVFPGISVGFRIVLQLIVEVPHHLLALVRIERYKTCFVRHVIRRPGKAAERDQSVRKRQVHIQRLALPPGPFVYVVSRVLAVAAAVNRRPPRVRRPVVVPLGDHILIHSAQEFIRFGLVGRVQGRILPDQFHECQDRADNQTIVGKPFGVFRIVLAVPVLPPAPVSVHVSGIVDFVLRHVRSGVQNAIDLSHQLVQPDRFFERPVEVQIHPLHVGRRTPCERPSVAAVQVFVSECLIPRQKNRVPVGTHRTLERHGRGFLFRRAGDVCPPEDNGNESVQTKTQHNGNPTLPSGPASRGEGNRKTGDDYPPPRDFDRALRHYLADAQTSLPGPLRTYPACLAAGTLSGRKGKSGSRNRIPVPPSSRKGVIFLQQDFYARCVHV